MSQSSDTQLLDTLYIQCYQQLIRHSVVPVFVEKRVLDKSVEAIRQFYFGKLKKLKDVVENTKKHNESSYLTWDPKYYQELASKQGESIREFETRLKETKSEDFLGEDFSKINDDLERNYPGILIKSTIREDLWNTWKSIHGKNE